MEAFARNLDLLVRLIIRAVEQADQVLQVKVLRADDYAAPLKRVRKAIGRISRTLETRGTKGETVAAVFKDGDKRKVKDDRGGAKNWNSVYPGLAPEVLSYKENRKSAALPIERIEGETFEDIVLGGSDEALADATKVLHKAVRDIWRTTRFDASAEMKAMDQLAKRMGDVHRLRPGHVRDPQSVNEHKIFALTR